MVAFNEIPNTLRVPFTAAEFDSSQASQGPSIIAFRALIIGQKLAAGSALANSLHKVTSPEDVIPLAARGAMLHGQAIAHFKSNRSTETWIAVLADDAAGVAATGTITVTGTATADGTIALYLGGVRITVGVLDTDTPTIIAAAIAVAINANLDLPVTAGSALGVVTVSYRHKGEVGNSYDIRHSHQDKEALPETVALAIVALASGTANPVLDTLIAALGDTWYHIWAHPYTDATSLTAIEGELASRNGPMRMIDGVAFSSAAGSFGALTTLGGGRNSRHSEIVAQPGENPLTPPAEFAAEKAAIVAKHGAIDPARPFQTLAMKHAQPPAEVDLFTIDERNLMLFEGIATTRVAGGNVQLGRPITTYQTNPSGADDTAYLDVNTMLTLMYLRFDFRNRFQLKYPRHKLAADGTQAGPGQLLMTPSLGRAEALGWFLEKETQGLLEGFKQFKNDLVVERNLADTNRLDFLLPPDLINQLMVTAVKIAFRL